jgi:hypothetical protein
LLERRGGREEGVIWGVGLGGIVGFG